MFSFRFDPHHGMRKVAAEDGFSKMGKLFTSSQQQEVQYDNCR